MSWNNLKFRILFFITLFCSSTLLAQTRNSILADNKLKSRLDTAVDYTARIYLQDSNTKGVSIGVYYKAKNYTYNYGKSSLATANNFYNIGSVAKPFVTTVLGLGAGHTPTASRERNELNASKTF